MFEIDTFFVDNLIQTLFNHSETIGNSAALSVSPS